MTILPSYPSAIGILQIILYLPAAHPHFIKGILRRIHHKGIPPGNRPCPNHLVIHIRRSKRDLRPRSPQLHRVNKVYIIARTSQSLSGINRKREHTHLLLHMPLHSPNLPCKMPKPFHILTNLPHIHNLPLNLLPDNFFSILLHTYHNPLHTVCI